MLAAAAAVLFGLRLMYRQPEVPAVIELPANPGALSAAFNADGEKLRVLAIVSPT